MTLNEAKIVASIVETAEGGCGGCVNQAIGLLNEKFPMFNWKPKKYSDFMASIEVELRPKNTEAPKLLDALCVKAS